MESKWLNEDKMLYKLRTGDILIAEDKENCRTNLYLITYDLCEGFSLTCMSCGESIGCYKENVDLLQKDIKGLLNVVGVIPKELIVDFANKNYKLDFKVKCHDICEKHELDVEVEI